MNETKNYMVVLVTAPNEDEATSIAKTLVEDRIAACVNVLPGCRSVYRWEGELQLDDETLMIIKTHKQCFADLEKRIAELHSYDVPEVIALELSAASAGYLSFLGGSLDIS